MDKKKTDPCTNEVLNSKSLFPNKIIQTLAVDFLEKHQALFDVFVLLGTKKNQLQSSETKQQKITANNLMEKEIQRKWQEMCFVEN